MVRSRKIVGNMSPTRGPTNCIKWPAATFYNHVYTIKIAQKFRPLGVPLIVNFTRASRKPTHSNGCGHIKKKGVRTHGVENSGYVNRRGILTNLAENWYGQIAYRISPYLTSIILIPFATVTCR
jgi:hypothetical protein